MWISYFITKHIILTGIFDNKIEFILYLVNLSSFESMAGKSIAMKSPFLIDSAHWGDWEGWTENELPHNLLINVVFPEPLEPKRMILLSELRIKSK